MKVLIAGSLLVVSFGTLAEVERFDFEANCRQTVESHSSANLRAIDANYRARIHVRVQHGHPLGPGRLSVALEPELSFFEQRKPRRAHLHTFTREFATTAETAPALVLVRGQGGEPSLRLAYDHHVMDEEFRPVLSRSTFILSRRFVSFHNPNVYFPLRRGSPPTRHGVRTICTLHGNLNIPRIQWDLAER